MGPIHAEIKLNNPQQAAIASISTLVDPAGQDLVPRDPCGPVSMAKGFAAQ